MRVAVLLLALTLCVAASAAQAAQKKREEQPYEPPPPTIVASPLALVIAGFDRDGDMVITRAEYDNGVAQSFALADSDKNGRMSMIELAAWSEIALGNRGALPGPFDFDRDGDDSISREEFVALCDARFASLDKDNDKALRRSELITFAPTRGRPPRGEGDGTRRMPPPR